MVNLESNEHIFSEHKAKFATNPKSLPILKAILPLKGN